MINFRSHWQSVEHWARMSKTSSPIISKTSSPIISKTSSSMITKTSSPIISKNEQPNDFKNEHPNNFKNEQPTKFNLFSGGGAGPTRPQVVFQQVVWKLLISLIFYKSRFILFFKSVFSYKNFIKFALKIVNLSCRSISVQLIHFTFLARRSRSTNGCLA